MDLIIAEKPSVGRTIASVVGANNSKDGYIEGNNYIVSWCFGHLIGLNEPDYYIDKSENDSGWNLNYLPIIPKEWSFKMNEDSGAKKQFKILKTLMYRTDVDRLICATDAGREGECIFRYVYNFANCKKPVLRLWTSSLEESAIKEGMNNLKSDSEYDELYEAGLCRAKADWLIGMNLSRLFTTLYKAKPVLSIGRVQTPTLAMIVERYNENRNFKSVKTYRTKLDFNKGFSAISIDKYDKKEIAEKKLIELSDKAIVEKYDREQKVQAAPKLFDLTLLQRVANNFYGYTAQETLDIAQKLYECKFITYPRTDSNYITTDMEQTAIELVEHIKGFSFVRNVEIDNPDIKCLINNKKVSDHHALLPTKSLTEDKYNSLSEKEKNIIFLISSRLLVAVAPKRKYYSVKAILDNFGYKYEAKGIKVVEEGFKGVEKQLGLVKKEETENNIPELIEKEEIGINNKTVIEQVSKPPALYTDASLLKAMETAGNSNYEESDVEKKGIGTPATRAGVIETLIKREYITRDKKKIIPTERGMNLISIVPKSIKTAKTTATWETALQKIERGELEKNKFLTQINALTDKIVSNYKSKVIEDNPFSAKLENVGMCPVCGKDVNEFNKVYKCSNKECDFYFYKSIASKTISKSNASKLLNSGSTGPIKGFISKSGKEFEATLKLDENNKIIFDF